MNHPTSLDGYANKLAIITGGGDGMGRSLAVALTQVGCHVAMCDINTGALEETKALCEQSAPSGTKITTHIADVSSEADLERFKDELLATHGATAAHLVFLNAGIGGGGSMFEAETERAVWERTFNICWGGVYLGSRVFLPVLTAADHGHLVNTSSVNGFWASIGPERSHTAYSAAKFAVKGFTEALVTDLRLNAPHVRCSVVMPGHIGTGIVGNSAFAYGVEMDDVTKLVDDGFRNQAPTSSDEAAQIILDQMLAGRWRILVGDDAEALDAAVRGNPERAYDPDFEGLGTIVQLRAQAEAQ